MDGKGNVYLQQCRNNEHYESPNTDGENTEDTNTSQYEIKWVQMIKQRAKQKIKLQSGNQNHGHGQIAQESEKGTLNRYQT